MQCMVLVCFVETRLRGWGGFAASEQPNPPNLLSTQALYRNLRIQTRRHVTFMTWKISAFALLHVRRVGTGEHRREKLRGQVRS